MAEKMTLIQLVDNNDRPIGYKERDKITKKDIYRVSALWVTSPDGHVLLARRSKKKSHDPGLWGVAVVGTVEKGETYLSNIKKEAFEEIGLQDIKPKKKIKEKFTGNWNMFIQWFAIVLPKETKFRIDKNEVEKVQWITKEKLLTDLTRHPGKYAMSRRRFMRFLT